MYQKYVKSVTYLTVAIASILIGILLIVKNVILFDHVIKLLAIVIFVNGLSFFIKSTFTKQKIGVGKAFFNSILGFVMLLFPKISLSILPICVSIYLLINSCICITYYFILKHSHESSRFIEILKFFLYLVLALPILYGPISNLKYVLLMIGSYMILFGLSSVIDCINEITPPKLKKRIKRRIRISLPIFITTFIPYSVLREMNGYLTVRNDIPLQESKKNEDIYDLEILVHVSNDDYGTIGHVDLWYNGEIISYGGYDMKARKFHDTICEGVLFTCDSKENYIHFCQKYSKKVLFGFGLVLTEEQKRIIENQIQKIKNDLYEWTPYYKRALLDQVEVGEDEYQDYVSVLYKMTHSKFYKFKRGKFKTFFIFTTNCVQLVDTIIGNAGLGIIKLSGLISPGSYYDYLYREFCKKNSMVVSYNIYMEGKNEAKSKS